MKRKEKRTLHGVLTLMLFLGLMLIPGLLPDIACAAEGLTQDENGVYQIEDYADLKEFAQIVNAVMTSGITMIRSTGRYAVCAEQKWITRRML